MDSNFWYRGTKVVDFRRIPGMAGIDGAPKRYHLMVQRFFFRASNHSIEPRPGHVLWLAALCSRVFFGRSFREFGPAGGRLLIPGEVARESGMMSPANPI
jgi:hypothetical protein